MLVKKRDCTIEDFNPEKMNNMCEWAVEGIPDVNWSEIVMSAMHKVSGEVVNSGDIQEALIQACLDKKDYNHNRVAGKLVLGDIYRSSLASMDFIEFYHQMVSDGYWREMNYTNIDLIYLKSKLDMDLDLEYGYPTLRQFVDKYALHDEDGHLLELPQYMYMGVAMSMMENHHIDDVLMYYRKASQHKINLPSPVLTGQRTNSNVGVSCVITTAGDSLHGIEATKHVAFMATASSAGLGVEYDVRSPKDPVRKGYAKAGGKLPHYFALEKITKEVKQSSRGGSATVTFKSIDPEIMTLLGLKLPRSVDEKRIDLLDYSMAINHTFLKYAAMKKDWALVSLLEHPKLHEEFYNPNPTKFEALMEEVLNDDNAKKTVVNAMDILVKYLDVRQETGREYEINLSAVNYHTPFKETIRLSNLCQEVVLPTKPYNHITELYKDKYEEGDGITAQCFLSAIDVGRIEDDRDYEETAYIVLKSLDNLINNMNYPFPQFKATAQGYRSVGVGITNLAYCLAKQGSGYGDVNKIHEISERHYYFLLKASVRLAKERGKFEFIEKTKWTEGWLPIDTYSKGVDDICNPELKYDWEGLRQEVLINGVRFSVLVAHMPCESSSVMTSATNGLYPIRKYVVYKNSRNGNIQFFPKEIDALNYEYAWDIPYETLINMYALIQKFTDQTISLDTYLDYSKYKDGKVSKSERIRNFLYANKRGIKTMYYENFKTVRGVSQDEPEDTKEYNEEDEACESCTL